MTARIRFRESTGPWWPMRLRRARRMTYEPVWDEAAPTVAKIARPGDLVITVGCGDVTKVAPRIVEEIERLTEAVR